MYLQELYNTLLIILLFIIYQPPVVYALGVRFYLQRKCQLNQRLIDFWLVKVAFCCQNTAKTFILVYIYPQIYYIFR